MKLITFALAITLLLPQAFARPATRLPVQERVIAIGDIHGDFSVFMEVLRTAKLVDKNGHWIGRTSVLVQTGDQIDRGDDDKKILDFLEVLEREARQAGGAVYALNGNHEVMNVAQDFRYITKKSFLDFDSFYNANTSAPEIDNLPASMRGRAQAFWPGNTYANKLARRNSVMIIGDTVFVHGGILPHYADYGLAKINREVSQWMKGLTPMPALADDDEGPFWSRHFSDDEEHPDANCELLEATLKGLGAKRMVVAHTVQPKINSRCNQKVWRIDVGLSRYYGSESIEVLEILKDSTFNIIRASRH